MTKKPLLSKSRYVRGLQCIKAMYLDTYNSKLARYDRETLAKFQDGRKFEAIFKGTFPNGIDISRKLGYRISEYPRLTQSYLEQPGEVVLYEAGFLHDDVVVLADVLHKHEDGSIHIYEVKHMNEVSEVVRQDVYVQYYVISHCLPDIAEFNVVYQNADYQESMPQEELFRMENLIHSAKERTDYVRANVAQFTEVLQGMEPQLEMGDHCSTPYKCPYMHYCKRFAANPIDLRKIW